MRDMKSRLCENRDHDALQTLRSCGALQPKFQFVVGSNVVLCRLVNGCSLQVTIET